MMPRAVRTPIRSAATTLRTRLGITLAMRLPSRWILPDLNTPPQSIASRVLWHRGLRDAAAVARFLNPRLDDLHDPMLLKDMDRAVDRLQRAIAGHEKILLYGDYDVDGTSSVVILKKVLDLTGAQVEFH